MGWHTTRGRIKKGKQLDQVNQPNESIEGNKKELPVIRTYDIPDGPDGNEMKGLR